MRTKKLFMVLLNTVIIMTPAKIFSQKSPDHDTLMADNITIGMWFIGHASLILTYGDFVVHVDPVAEMGDYSSLPKADLILITHQHSDHFGMNAISAIKKENTQIVCNQLSSGNLKGAVVMKNGDTKVFSSIKIEAVPAYNILHERAPGKPFHPRGEGNGYVITFGNKRIYVAGDTEDIPEMANLKNIDVAFLPMNLPYTMTPEMVARACAMFNPKILYPYHYGNTDAKLLLPLVDSRKTEVRIRNLK